MSAGTFRPLRRTAWAGGEPLLFMALDPQRAFDLWEEADCRLSAVTDLLDALAGAEIQDAAPSALGALARAAGLLAEDARELHHGAYTLQRTRETERKQQADDAQRIAAAMADATRAEAARAADAEGFERSLEAARKILAQENAAAQRIAAAMAGAMQPEIATAAVRVHFNQRTERTWGEFVQEWQAAPAVGLCD